MFKPFCSHCSVDILVACLRIIIETRLAARGTPEAQFPKTAAETAGGTAAGKMGVVGGVPGALLGKLPGDRRTAGGTAGRLPLL